MTYILPEGSLDVQRMINRLSLPHEALLLFKSRASSAGGMSTITYTDEAEADKAACRLAAAGASEPERLIAAQIASIDKFICTFDVNTDLPLDSRIKVSGISDCVAWVILLQIKGRLQPKEDFAAIEASYYCEPLREGASSSEG